MNGSISSGLLREMNEMSWALQTGLGVGEVMNIARPKPLVSFAKRSILLNLPDADLD